MLGRAIGIAALPLVVGCLTTQTVVVPFEFKSEREFPPEQRDQVWTRAVNAFGWTGRIPEVTDEGGGLLVSMVQGSMIQCVESRNGPLPKPSMCRANESTRLSIGAGVVSLRIAGKVGGTVLGAAERVLPMTDLDLKQQQVRLERWLDYVVGKTDYKPDPPNPPLAAAWQDL